MSAATESLRNGISSRLIHIEHAQAQIVADEAAIANTRAYIARWQAEVAELESALRCLEDEGL